MNEKSIGRVDRGAGGAGSIRFERIIWVFRQEYVTSSSFAFTLFLLLYQNSRDIFFSLNNGFETSLSRLAESIGIESNSLNLAIFKAKIILFLT